MLENLSPEATFTRIEEDARRYWRRHQVPDLVRVARRTGPPSVVKQQPVVVAGQHWSEQVRLLATADLLARYRTMLGDSVQVQTHWACHGLPIEVTVEQALGPNIMEYDLAQFNAACRTTAMEGMGEAEALAEWLGAWLDWANVDASMSSQAIDAAWQAVRGLWDAGHLRKARQVAPFCPRCATPLSESETSRRSIQVEAPAIWLRLPWASEPDTYLLTWTRHPWMLLGMVGVAVNPDAAYVLVELPGEEGQPASRLLLAEAALGRALSGRYRVVRQMTGKSLRGTRCRPPFTFLPIHEGMIPILSSEGVSLERGTGLLPVTPASHGLSLALAQDNGLTIPKLLDDSGKLDDQVTPWRGLLPHDSEPFLVQDLEARGLLQREETESRPLALCPYCETPLLPQATDVWLVETAGGPWIVSRDRAWGAPLPIWECQECSAHHCVAGVEDLARLAGLTVDEIALHRPAIDRVIFPCSLCGGSMRRLPTVLDSGFESAILSQGMRDVPGLSGAEEPTHTMAVGLGDKHIGWLGELTELAALLHGSLAWEQAIALPESQSDSMQTLSRNPSADAMRWAVFQGTTLEQAERQFLRPLWQLTVLCGEGSNSGQDGNRTAPVGENQSAGLMDLWLESRLQQITVAVDEAMDAGQTGQATAELSLFVGDLLTWYAPLRPQGLPGALAILSRLLAPFTPHLAEGIHRQLEGRNAQSVHLLDWPQADPAKIDRAFLADMAVARHVAVVGQMARDRANVESDRTLRRALVGFTRELDADPAVVKDLWAAALGVRRIGIDADAMKQVNWHLALKRDRVVDRGIPPRAIDAALADLDSEASTRLVAQLWEGRSIGLDVSGQALTLLPDEVSILAQARPGWTAAGAAGCLVILDMD